MRIYHMNGCGNRFAIFDSRMNKPFRPEQDELRRIASPNGTQVFDQIIGIEHGFELTLNIHYMRADAIHCAGLFADIVSGRQMVCMGMRF